MLWIIGGGILYFVLIVTLGTLTLRKGHWVIFVIGIFLPFFVASRRDPAFAFAEACLLGEPAMSLLR